MNILIYFFFSFVALFAYFKNFWHKNAEVQDIVVYLIMHLLMCLILLKVFGV